MYNFDMRIHLTKWGNSLGIRLPKIFAVQMGVDTESEVEIEVHKGAIVISKPKESLSALLKTLTPDMLHGETGTGDAVGKEVW